MNESVETFLGLAARYLQFANIESLRLEVLTTTHKDVGPTPNTEALMQAQHERNKARAAMLPVGRKLAAELEAEGHDSTELLTFLHAADAGGGPPAAFPLWPSLKVQLQRILLGALSDDTEWKRVRITEAGKNFGVTSKTIREWLKGKPPSHIRIEKSGHGWVKVHPDNWET